MCRREPKPAQDTPMGLIDGLDLTDQTGQHADRWPILAYLGLSQEGGKPRVQLALFIRREAQAEISDATQRVALLLRHVSSPFPVRVV